MVVGDGEDQEEYYAEIIAICCVRSPHQSGVRLNATHNYVYMINKRHFWKLNKQTLSSPPPPDPPQPQETQGEQPTQSETQTVQPAPSETQSAPVQQPQTQNKVQHNKKNKNKQQTVPNPIIHTPIISPLHNLPPDGIVFKHEQKWFVRFFGAGVAAQFTAWVIFLDLIGRNPKLVYSLSYPALGACFGTLFAYFARELVTHHIREIKLFPGGKAVEIVCYNLWGGKKIELFATNPKPFKFEEWRKNPYTLKFAVKGDRMQYFVNFRGEFRDTSSLEVLLNGELPPKHQQ